MVSLPAKESFTNQLPLVSIVVSNYNGWKFNLLRMCLDSILKIDYPNFEVILVDNASTDGSVEFCRRLFGEAPRLKIIVNTENIYSQGLNRGIELSKGKYIVFFNNDIKVDPNYLTKLIEILEADKTIALAQGKLLSYYNHHRIDSVGETMDIYGNPITIGQGEIDNGQYERISEILSASGSASVVRRCVLDEIGEFDSKFYIGYEDMDISLRARLRGYRVVYIPDAVVYHKRTATDNVNEIRVKVKYHFNKNRLATIIKNYSARNLLMVLPINLLLYLSVFIYEALIKRNIKWALPRLTGFLWNIKEIKYLLSQRENVQKNIRCVSDDEFLKLISKKPLLKAILAFARR